MKNKSGWLLAGGVVVLYLLLTFAADIHIWADGFRMPLTILMVLTTAIILINARLDKYKFTPEFMGNWVIGGVFVVMFVAVLWAGKDVNSARWYQLFVSVALLSTIAIGVVHLTVAKEQADATKSQTDMIRDQQEKITKQSEKIAAQGESIKTQGEEIKAQGVKITKQGEGIKAQSAKITEQSGEITGQGEEIKAQGEEIKAQSVKITKQSGEIAAQGKDIKAQGDKITGESKKIAVQSARVEEQGGAVEKQAKGIRKEASAIAENLREIKKARTAAMRQLDSEAVSSLRQQVGRLWTLTMVATGLMLIAVILMAVLVSGG